MHRFSLFVAMLIFLGAAAGCGGKKNPMSGKDALNEDDKALLTYINLAQEDSIDAIEHAQAFTAMVSDKVQKMSDQIEAGNCTYVKQLPDNRYDRSWTGRVEVDGGATCPVISNRRWSFDSARGEWNMSEHYLNKNEEYKKLDAVLSKDATGAMSVRQLAGTSKITGTFTHAFKISEVGPVSVKIETSQEYQGSRGNGALAMEMLVNNEHKYVVEIKWNGGMQATYKINNHDSEKKEVDGLFSALGLLEIMDRSEKMR